jgi:poly(3-hydroxybutyrate) depolymerase
MKTVFTFLRSWAPQNLRAVLLAAGLYAGCSGAAFGVSVEDFVARWFTNGSAVLPYRLFIPTNYTPAERFPLVLFLHGSGGCGNDNWYQLVDQTGPLVFASETNQVSYPSFMLAPQCPCGDGWNDWASPIAKLITELATEFSIDTNRLYITGLSMGGSGTWSCLNQFPHLFAAAIPMSGTSDNPGLAPQLTPMPIWDFHAADDPVVSVSGSRVIISLIRRAGGSPIYTEYATGGHAIWTPAYNTPGLMDWVYAQRRGVPSTHEPRLTITNPPPGAVWRTGASSLNLAGTAGALGRAITKVNWTNFANNAKGVAAGTNSWNATGIPLSAGATNVLAVVGYTTSWAPQYGGATTFNAALTAACYPLQASLALQQTGAMLNWTGGGPPYRVQQATDLAAGDWTDFLTNATPPVPVPITGHAGFYRVAGQ